MCERKNEVETNKRINEVRNKNRNENRKKKQS